jgi:hypothetical protein
METNPTPIAVAEDDDYEIPASFFASVQNMPLDELLELNSRVTAESELPDVDDFIPARAFLPAIAEEIEYRKVDR